jgi:hypothetical protein
VLHKGFLWPYVLAKHKTDLKSTPSLPLGGKRVCVKRVSAKLVKRFVPSR